jgi:vacuolar-type H+-ATPase subunit H
MSPTQKAPAKKPPRQTSRAPEHAHARCKENDRLITRITDSLDVAQADLSKLGSNLEAGVGELRRELSRLLRDARRNAAKMGKATRKDLERLQKDMVATAKKAKPNGTAAAKPKRTAAAKPKRTAAGKARTGKPRARSSSAAR